MRTLGIRDIADGNKKIYSYNPDLANKIDQKDCFDNQSFKIKKVDRIVNFFDEIKHSGNIAVYLIRGNKYRRLFVRYNWYARFVLIMRLNNPWYYQFQEKNIGKRS